MRALSILLLVLTGCASAAHDEGARDALLRTDREWSEIASAGKDVERVLSYWTDDASVYPAGEPAVQGKAAIRQFVNASLAIPGFSIRWTPADATVSADGTMGYTTGQNFVTVPGPEGRLMTLEARYVTIWRREPGGAWKCVVDTWNAGPAPQP